METSCKEIISQSQSYPCMPSTSCERYTTLQMTVISQRILLDGDFCGYAWKSALLFKGQTTRTTCQPLRICPHQNWSCAPSKKYKSYYMESVSLVECHTAVLRNVVATLVACSQERTAEAVTTIYKFMVDTPLVSSWLP